MFIFPVIRKGISSQIDLANEETFSTSNLSFCLDKPHKPSLKNEELLDENKRLNEDMQKMILEIEECRLIIDEIDEQKNHYRSYFTYFFPCAKKIDVSLFSSTTNGYWFSSQSDENGDLIFYFPSLSTEERRKEMQISDRQAKVKVSFSIPSHERN